MTHTGAGGESIYGKKGFKEHQKSVHVGLLFLDVLFRCFFVNGSYHGMKITMKMISHHLGKKLF